jgi:hypothetical protein
VDNVGILILFGLAIGFIWWAYQQGRPGAIAFIADRPPREVVVAALQNFTLHGWTTTSQTKRTISFARTQSPGCLITGFLLLFGLIPGLLYWIAAKRTLTVSVAVQPDPGGTDRSIVSIAWSRNGGGRGPSLQFKELIASGVPIVMASPSGPSVVAEQIEDVTAGALSAAQLRAQTISGQPVSLPAPSCTRCGRTDLSDREAKRTPNLCDSCLNELQAT